MNPPMEILVNRRRHQPVVMPSTPSVRRSTRSLIHAHMRNGLLLLLALMLCGASTGSLAADDVSAAQMQSLDEQVQEIKSDVLRIAAELNGLEETLLYPSNTQVAVFVSLAENDSSQLDSVQIHIDGEPVAHHIYSFKELDALRKGGVQRIYTGNVPTGSHDMQVSIAGKRSNGRDFSETNNFSFHKEVEPKIVGIKLASNEAGDAKIQLEGR